MASGEGLKTCIAEIAALTDDDFAKKSATCFGDLWRCFDGLSEEARLQALESITEPDASKVYTFLFRLAKEKKLFTKQIQSILEMTRRVKSWEDAFQAHPDLTSKIPHNINFTPLPRKITEQSSDGGDSPVTKVVKSDEAVIDKGHTPDTSAINETSPHGIETANSFEEEDEKRTYTWMWGDLWDDAAARLNPLRWSKHMTRGELMTDILNHNDKLAKPIHIKECEGEQKMYTQVSSWQELLKDIYGIDDCGNCQYYSETERKWCDGHMVGIQLTGVLVDTNGDPKTIGIFWSKLATHLRPCVPEN